MSKDFAIFIVSCDKYADLWEPFFTCFWRQWPDCTYPVYLLTNNRVYSGKFRKKVKTLKTGDDRDWSTSAKKGLEHIPQKYIFMWNEDLFLSKKVDSVLFAQYFAQIKALKGKHIHYMCKPPTDRFSSDGSLGIYDRGMPYRSIVMGFWDKQYLSQLLLAGETPWSFEIMGSYRTSYDDGFYCATTPVLTFAHMVEKGRWLAAGVRYCKQAGIRIKHNARGLRSGVTIKSRLLMVYFDVMLRVSWRVRLAVLNIVRKAIVSY
jgi:hypothetical protein